MEIHEIVAENRLRFASQLNEMSEELVNLAKEADKNRTAVYPHLINKSFSSFTSLLRPVQGTCKPLRTCIAGFRNHYRKEQSASRYYEGRTCSYFASEGDRTDQARPISYAGQRDGCGSQSCGEGWTVVKRK